MLKFNEFLNSLVIENLHPELKSIISAGSKHKSMQTQIASKVKELTSKGEHTGIEGNMPKGSSRAYLKHEKKEEIKIDGKPAKMDVGTKVTITSPLDKFHNKKDFNDQTLGQMQNETENGDYLVNSHHRVLSKDEHGNYHSNEHGIFPPLIHHDYDNHNHSTVGHVEKIKKSEFKHLTKSEEHPNGISHEDFTNALKRFHNKHEGKYREGDSKKEKHLDEVHEPPLVQKFIDYHGSWGHPPHDYEQIENMGKWKHPVTGEHHIVARDHGYSTDVQKAYIKARQAKNR